MNHNSQRIQSTAGGFSRRVKQLINGAIATPEGQILFAGFIVALLYIAWIGFSYFSSIEEFQVLVGMTATHVLFGRAAGMSFGYSLGFGHGIVFTANVIIETVIIMFFYPLFVFTIRKLLVFNTLKNIMERMHRAAEANRGTVQRYGIPGIFLFVLFPFWGTGPVVGSVIGYLLALRPWMNIGIVLGGTYLACILWAILLKELHERVAAFSPFAPMILVAIVIIIVVAGFILGDKHRDDNTQQK